MLNKAETLCQNKKKSFRGTILPLLESLEVKVHTYVIYKQNHKMLLTCYSHACEIDCLRFISGLWS